MQARLPDVVRTWSHATADLGCQHDSVPTTLQGLADKRLQIARRIDIGGVHKIDAPVDRFVDDAFHVREVQVAHRTRPGTAFAEGHRPKAKLRHENSSRSKLPILHLVTPSFL